MSPQIEPAFSWIIVRFITAESPRNSLQLSSGVFGEIRKLDWLKYSGPLNTMGLNDMSPLICGFFFSLINTTGLHNSRLVQSLNVEPQVQRNPQHGGSTLISADFSDYLEGWHSPSLHCSRVNSTGLFYPGPVSFGLHIWVQILFSTMSNPKFSPVWCTGYPVLTPYLSNLFSSVCH